ncbi:MAG: adenosylmethionine decarboxylase [Alphaproteobacteria bacterium]
MSEASTGIHDRFVERDGRRHAGIHVIADLWDAHDLDDPAALEAALREAALAAGATILDCRLHHFSPNLGVTGVLLLAESHISIHTWPEHDFAAVDIFLCGDADPDAAVAVLRRRLQPGRVAIQTLRRGLMP